jgi:hypothetical protein
MSNQKEKAMRSLQEKILWDARNKAKAILTSALRADPTEDNPEPQGRDFTKAHEAWINHYRMRRV